MLGSVSSPYLFGHARRFAFHIDCGFGDGIRYARARGFARQL